MHHETQTIRQDRVYYHIDPDGRILDGPFCPDCFEQDDLSIRMNSWPTKPFLICPRCKLGTRIEPHCPIAGFQRAAR